MCCWFFLICKSLRVSSGKGTGFEIRHTPPLLGPCVTLDQQPYLQNMDNNMHLVAVVMINKLLEINTFWSLKIKMQGGLQRLAYFSLRKGMILLSSFLFKNIFY